MVIVYASKNALVIEKLVNFVHINFNILGFHGLNVFGFLCIKYITAFFSNQASACCVPLSVLIYLIYLLLERKRIRNYNNI